MESVTVLHSPSLRGLGIAAAILLAAGCGSADPGARRDGTATLLLSQAQFTKVVGAGGKPEMSPMPARLLLLREQEGRFLPEAIEDPDSNVFHKAIFLAEGNSLGLPAGFLSIGANKAALKAWTRSGGAWSAVTLWQPTFGSGNDRLRDFEIGDVDGDDRPDIVVGTHDQGVVAVLTGSGASWTAQEIDRKPDTFVHEVELADLDRDGVQEIYATPSAPNRFDGTPQPGEVVTYRFRDGSFERRVVETFERRHVKELVVADLDGDGTLSLIAAAEADLGSERHADSTEVQTLLRRYQWIDGDYAADTAYIIPDRLCRFLNAGDVDGDGKIEIVASTHCQGVWVLWPRPGAWEHEVIDAASSGFEHASTLADLDEDGVLEVYVAADTQFEIRRHRFVKGQWRHDALYKLEQKPLKMNFFIDGARFQWEPRGREAAGAGYSPVSRDAAPPRPRRTDAP